MSIYQYLMDVVEEKGAGYLPLLDPDRLDGKKLVQMATHLEAAGVDALLIGSSLLLSPTIDTIIQDIKREIKIPVIIFPGSLNQVSQYADAILFLSLISGRNPDRLIGDQVKAAPAIKEYGIEPIIVGSTGDMRRIRDGNSRKRDSILAKSAGQLFCKMHGVAHTSAVSATDNLLPRFNCLCRLRCESVNQFKVCRIRYKTGEKILSVNKRRFNQVELCIA